ncbi:hypothetical protein ANCCAN_01086 [Ancylostoma caninum]|uniref:Methyltransferase FkbM domain-containing protein n=1 Tax=Ancylostoma caninum TaxID=29170 RepID=A0A368HBF4_ANCCA|nr:hypothetical protein ANCCAN_01086 [Ancylostoma caninum]
MGFSTIRVVLLPLIAIVVLICIYKQMFFSEGPKEGIQSEFHSISADKISKVDKVRNAFAEWHGCMVAKFETERKDLKKLWISFENMTRDCTAASEVSKIVLSPFENKDEIKYYVFGKNASDPSVVVSLGIGADVTAELKLRDKLAKGSEFFGADPVVSPNDELFGKVGIFFPLAVSKKTGLVQSGIREDDGSYRTMNTVSIDIVTFLKEMVNRTIIDHMILDNEGPEYDIVPMIAVDKTFDDNGILICHMNIEFHAPGPKERHQLFEEVIAGVLSAKRFAPLYNAYRGHQRSFFINYHHPYCIEKYLTQFF